MKPENMVGKLVEIKNNDYWTGFWGFIRAWDGKHFHVSGGAIARNNEITPIFSRNELKIPGNIAKYIEMGAVDNDGNEIKNR